MIKEVSGVSVTVLLEMLWLLVLIIVHHHILIIQKITFSVLGEGTTEGIDGNIATAEKKIVLILVK